MKDFLDSSHGAHINSTHGQTDNVSLNKTLNSLFGGSNIQYPLSAELEKKVELWKSLVHQTKKLEHASLYISDWNLMLFISLLQIERLHLLLTIRESAMDVPTNVEARRRIAFFTNSMFMDMPPPPKIRNSPSGLIYS